MRSEVFLYSLYSYHAKESDDWSDSKANVLPFTEILPAFAFFTVKLGVDQQYSCQVNEEKKNMREPHNDGHLSKEVDFVQEPLWKSEQCHSTQHVVVDSVPAKAAYNIISPSSLARLEPFSVINDWIEMP